MNGSGKHNNWSLGTDTGTPLLAPGKDALGNLQFITFFVNVLAAVQKHNGLLKASIASATNAHRLGANEAPPAAPASASPKSPSASSPVPVARSACRAPSARPRPWTSSSRAA